MLDLKDVRLPAFLLDPAKIDSVVLRRLVEEVQAGDVAAACYDRIHNRHNRGR